MKDIMKRHKDITVIIPSYFPGEIIGHVLVTVDEGLTTYFPEYKSIIVVVDSSDHLTQKMIQNKCIGLKTETKCILYKKRKTKGKAIFKGFEIARECSSKAILMLDSDLKSIKPVWIKSFVEPILEDKVDFVGPNYVRDKYDSLITNHIIFPFIKNKLKCDLRQAIGGDFAFSEKILSMYVNNVAINKEVYGFGIDIWLSVSAIVNGLRIGQVYLGTKDHGVTIKDPARPEESLGGMFIEVSKTLFDLLVNYEHKISGEIDRVPVLNLNNYIEAWPKPVLADFDNLWSTFLRLYPRYSSLYEKEVGNELALEVDSIYKQPGHDKGIDVQLWANFLNNFYLYYKNLETEKEKRDAISSLLPIYFGRIACYVEEAKDLSPILVEEKIQKDAEFFS